jgi:DNA-binding beta-propeller fold protein YncE
VNSGNHEILSIEGCGVERTGDCQVTKIIGNFGEKEGEFNNPLDIIIIGSQVGGYRLLLVVDSGNNRIQEIDSEGNFIRAWGKYGQEQGEFDHPTGITYDNERNIYVADYGNNRIQKFNREGSFILQWGIKGNGPGEFDGPYDITSELKSDSRYGQEPYLYVTDKNNYRIQKFTFKGEFVKMWGEKGEVPGQFNSPTGIETDGGTKIFVMDTGNNRLQKFYTDGSFELEWGGGILNSPMGMQQYIVDTGNNRIFDCWASFLG